MEKPDFIQIPKQVFSNPDLQPLDLKLYGIIYWLSKLKNEKCTASNETLGELIDAKEKSVQASLDRLEKTGAIKRLYFEGRAPKDRGKVVRKEIVPLVVYQQIKLTPANEGVTPANEGVATPANEGENKNNKEDKYKEYIHRVFDAYKSSIMSGARPLREALQNIKNRLKTYSEAELLDAVSRFKANSWWMENNAKRGAAWFFKSDKRIEQFLNIEPERKHMTINLDEELKKLKEKQHVR